MARGLKFLVDTNVWLELLLQQEKAEDVRKFFTAATSETLAISDFSLHSLCVILTRLNHDNVAISFLNDLLNAGVAVLHIDQSVLHNVIANRQKFDLDFDDAYQYTTAEIYDCTLVSFDKDFDRTDKKRITPMMALQ